MKLYSKIHSTTKSHILMHLCLLLFTITLSYTTQAQKKLLDVELISLSEKKIGSSVLGNCWNSLGFDSLNNLYSAWGTYSSPEDLQIFRYSADTKEVTFIGSAQQTLKNADNKYPGENVPKGHSAIPFYKGRMYIATMPFHDINFRNSGDYGKHRGSHILAYEIPKDTMIDLSADEPQGVFQRYQGIMAIEKMPKHDLMVGFSHPKGDLLFFDPNGDSLVRVVPGPPEEFAQGSHVPRTIVVSGSKVYYAMAWEDSELYIYDYEKDETVQTQYSTTGGFWNGLAVTTDHKTAYISTILGNLYQLNIDKDSLSFVTNLFDNGSVFTSDKDPQIITSLALTTDESTLIFIPNAHRAELKETSKHNSVYGYDIEKKRIDSLGFIKTGSKNAYTGFNIKDDDGNIYFSWHDYSHDGLLVKLNIGPDTANSKLTIVAPSIVEAGINFDLKVNFEDMSHIDEFGLYATIGQEETELYKGKLTSSSIPLMFEDIGDVELRAELLDDYGNQYNSSFSLTTVTSALATSGIDRAFDVTVYPNPAIDQFRISMPKNMQGQVTVRLVHISGSIAFSETFDASDLVKVFPKVNKGIYLLSISGEGINHTQRLIFE